MRLSLAVLVILLSIQGVASAQAMFTGSIGSVFGGSAPSTKNVWAIAIGGGGAHNIGSELEFSETRNFFERADGTTHGKVVTLMPSVFVSVPAGPVRPYGIFGFGFIRERPEGSGGLFSDLSDDDIGYAIGGGVMFKFAPHAGVRADLRHFKVRTSDGISFRRFLVGIVLGG
jgi:opacity protein-like surface antigen